MRDRGLPPFNIDYEIEEFIKKTKKRDQKVTMN